MNDPLMQELERLERQNRWLGRVLIAALFVAVAGLAAGFRDAPADVLSAEKATVTDDKGNDRVSVTATATGAELSVRDSRGEVGLRLAVGADGPELRLFDEKGVARVRLVSDEKKGTVLELIGQGEKARVCLVEATDKPGFVLTDAEGRTRAAMACDDRNGGLVLLDERGKSAASLSVVNEVAGLVLHDETGALRTKLAADSKGSGLSMYDEGGMYLFQFGSYPANNGLTLHDAKGRLRGVLGVGDRGPLFSRFSAAKEMLELRR